MLFLETGINLGLLQFCTATFALFLATIYYVNRNRSLPPGPIGLPCLGYWPFLKNPISDFEELRKKYGNVFCFTVCGRLFVCLGSLKSLQEAHVEKFDCFSYRTSDFSLQNVAYRGGLVSLNSEPWKVLRKFFLKAFKEHGVLCSKNNMAGALYDGTTSLVKELHAKQGEPASIVEILLETSTMILRRNIFNDIGLTPDKCRVFVEEIARSMLILETFNLMLIGKISRYVILPFNPIYVKSVESIRNMDRILHDIVKEHESTFDEHHIRNVVDRCIKERIDRRLRSDPTADYFTADFLVPTLHQFLADGMLPVGYFVAVFFQSLVQHPEEQDKIYQELVEVLGHEEEPSVENKSKLPYTNAFIYETLRMTDFFPFFPSRECMKDITLQGFRIPKGSITVMNTWLIHHDPEVYERPYVFDPTRYLVTPGKAKAELPILFGTGKRACIAEPFAMMQVFLLVATVVKKFRLSLPAGMTDDEISAMFKSGNWKMCAHARSEK